MIAAQAPELHEMLDRAKREGWPHLLLEGTLIHIDRIGERNDEGHHLWYSGKHKTQGVNVQIVADPIGFPMGSPTSNPAASTTSPLLAGTVWVRCMRPPLPVCRP